MYAEDVAAFEPTRARRAKRRELWKRPMRERDVSELLVAGLCACVFASFVFVAFAVLCVFCLPVLLSSARIQIAFAARSKQGRVDGESHRATPNCAWPLRHDWLSRE